MDSPSVHQPDMESQAQLLRFFLSSTPVAVAMCDREMNYLYYSERWISDFGLPDEDLTGRCHYDVFGDIPDRWKAEHQRCLAGETLEGREEPFQRADGRIEWIRRNLRPWRTDGGEIGGVMLLVEKITDRKQVEANARQMADRIQEIGNHLRLMENVVENSPAVIFRWQASQDWPVNYVSENVIQFGYAAADLISGRIPFASLVHPEDIERIAQEVTDHTLAGTDHFQQEYRILTATGDVRWVDDRSVIERDQNGDVTHYQGVVLDITDRKQAEGEIVKRQLFLESVLHQAPDAIITLDDRHQVIDWNPGAEKIFGYAQAEAMGRELDDLIAPDENRHKAEANRKTRQILAGGRVEAYETVRYHKNGQPIQVIAAGSPIMIGGILNGVVAMYTDISALKQAEEKFHRNARMLRRIIDIVPSMIFVKNGEGRFLMANRAVAESYRLAPEQLVGRLQGDLHPDDRQVEQYLADDRRAIETGQIIYIPEEPYRNIDGEERWLEVIKVPCDDRDFGEPAVVALATDITRRREIQKRYRTVFENTGTGTVLIEADGTLSMVNREFAQMVGYARREIEGRMQWNAFVTPEDVQRLKAYQHSRNDDPYTTPDQFECGLVDRAGRVKPVLMKTRRIPDTDTTIRTFLDISDRKQAEEAMAEANRMLRLVLDTIPVRVFWKDRECRYLGCNQPFAQDAGCRGPEELIGKNDYDLFREENAEAFRRDDRAVMETGQPRLNYEEPQATPTRQPIWVQTNKVPMRDSQENIIGILGTYQDVTDRKQAHDELKRLRNYLSNIINSMPSVLVGVDADGRVTQWNHQAEEMTGLCFDEAANQPLASVFPQLVDEMDRVKEAIKNRNVIRDTKIPRRQKGEIRFEDITIFPLVANGVEGAVIRVDDVTERVRLEEMMIQSEKMLSVGGLAAGMAHEINNPLAGILQNTAVLENRLMGDLPANRRAAERAGFSLPALNAYLDARKLPEMLENIRSSGNRAAEIVRNMLSFARKSDRAVSSHELDALLDQTVELARTDYDMKKRYDFKQIKIIKDYAPAVPPVPCEASKLQQVFLNILKNGAEAMASATDNDDSPAFILRVVDEDAWVRIEIEDNGPGMNHATRRRIFEPFFTTKPVGEGTGLGLSVSYFIITENHGGEMDVKAVNGRGTRFVIRLPKSGKPDPNPIAKKEARQP